MSPRLESAYEGEDVPIQIDYEDDAGAAADPDAAPTITITDSDGVSQISDVAMTGSAGSYEHVWDTATNADGTGRYIVEITAEFTAETKISRGHLNLE